MKLANHGFAVGQCFSSPGQSSSPYINQFLSADTIVQSFANPQNLNRYSYVTNNPLRYIDPTGHSADCGIGNSIVKLEN